MVLWSEEDADTCWVGYKRTDFRELKSREYIVSNRTTRRGSTTHTRVKMRSGVGLKKPKEVLQYFA